MTTPPSPFAQVGDVFQVVAVPGRIVKVINVTRQDCTWSPYMYTLQSERGGVSVAGNWLAKEKYFTRLPAECWRERRTMQLGLGL